MKINEKDVVLKITPRAIKIVEDKYPDFDIIGIYYNCQKSSTIPRITDSLKIVYTGYVGNVDKDIEFDDFLNLIEDVHFLEINNAAIGLLENLKN